MSLASVKQHMGVIDAHGVQIGTVDRVLDDGVQVTASDDLMRATRRYFIPAGVVVGVSREQVQLSANAHVATLFEENKDASQQEERLHREEMLDEALMESFPASDSPAIS